MSPHRTWIEIDRGALWHNVNVLRSFAVPTARVCYCVKANAYGHGLETVLSALQGSGVDTFSVDTWQEGRVVKTFFPTALVLVMGYTMQDELEQIILNDLDQVVYDDMTVRTLQIHASRHQKVARVHLKIDTGITRQGIFNDQIKSFLTVFRTSPSVRLVGLSTHFANIEDTHNPAYATLQVERFEQAIKMVREQGFDPEHIHAANSAATILYPSTHFTMVRPGIAVYGIWPSPLVTDMCALHNVRCDLKPVLSWKTRVAQIKSIPIGTAIGYGLTETVNRPSRIAIIPVGYADSFSRNLSSIGEVLINGFRCKVMGRVCMNMSMVDVSDIPTLQPEQEVVIIGTSGRFQMTADMIAQKINTISYEILARLPSTIPRIVV